MNVPKPNLKLLSSLENNTRRSPPKVSLEITSKSFGHTYLSHAHQNCFFYGRSLRIIFNNLPDGIVHYRPSKIRSHWLDRSLSLAVLKASLKKMSNNIRSEMFLENNTRRSPTNDVYNSILNYAPQNCFLYDRIVLKGNKTMIVPSRLWLMHKHSSKDSNFA